MSKRHCVIRAHAPRPGFTAAHAQYRISLFPLSALCQGACAVFPVQPDLPISKKPELPALSSCSNSPLSRVDDGPLPQGRPRFVPFGPSTTALSV